MAKASFIGPRQLQGGIVQAAKITSLCRKKSRTRSSFGSRRNVTSQLPHWPLMDQNRLMDRIRPVEGWRAVAMAMALFAITLNFLQPLTHASMLRNGVPSALWSLFCNANIADSDSKSNPVPGVAGQHECCLGLASAKALGPPPLEFVVVEPLVVAVPALLSSEQPTLVGIRDGPSQPRGPPILV